MGSVVVPFRDPFLRPDLAIEGELSAGPGGASIRSWMTVDSGATGLAIPAWVAKELRLSPLEGVSFNLLGNAARTYDAQATIVPFLSFGRWHARSALAAIIGDRPLIGQSVLAHAPWEIDWEHGTLIFDATVWPEDAADVVTLPLRHDTPSDTDFLTVQIDGRPFEFLLDTGARVSALSEAAGRGLPTRAFGAPLSFRGATDVIPVRRQFHGDTRLGTAEVGDWGFVELPGGREKYGNLGLDLLSRFQVQVVPGKHLALRPRADIWQTAGDRTSRWPWTAGCRHSGCLTASMEPVGDDARLVVEFERPYQTAAKVIFGCRGDSAPVLSTSHIFAMGGSVRGTFHHIVAEVKQDAAGRQEANVKLGAKMWFSRKDACHDPCALDVVPLERSEAPAVPLLASIAL